MAKRNGNPAQPEDELYNKYTEVRAGLHSFADAADDAELRVRVDLGKLNAEYNAADLLVREVDIELRRAVAELDDLTIRAEAALARAGVPYRAPGAILTDALAQVGLHTLRAASEPQEPPSDRQKVVTVEFERTRGDDAGEITEVLGPLGWPATTVRRTDQ